jgi:hypothetical protein
MFIPENERWIKNLSFISLLIVFKLKIYLKPEIKKFFRTYLYYLIILIFKI